MKTKFMSLDEPKKEVKKTVFNHYLNEDLIPIEAENLPEHYGNVLYIGNAHGYGDVFKAWDDGEEDMFTIFFGEKGDEF